MPAAIASLPNPIKTTTPIIPALVKRTSVKQICTYQVILKSDNNFSWQDKNSQDEQVLEAVFDHIINREELAHWLTPWLNIGYSLANVIPWEWKVYNPITREYETVWNKSSE